MSNVNQEDKDLKQNLRSNLLPWYRKKDFLQIIGTTAILVLIFWVYIEKVLIPKFQEENSDLQHDNELIRADLNKLRSQIDSKSNKDASLLGKRIKNQNVQIKLLDQNRNKKPQAGLVVPSRVDIAMLQDYTIEQDRLAIIADLSILASRAQQYYATSVTDDGGGKSFVGLTADSSGLARLASTTLTDNANGKYSIKIAGNIYRVTLHGVGKVALPNGTFPTYDMVVSSVIKVPSKLN
jgi:hypothetical protein